MLFLLFHLADDRYALAASQVAEVLPLVRIKRLPQAPRGVAGAIEYRGTVVPVIDLSALALERPAAQRMNTRIVLVHYGSRLLGLVAERVTQTLRLELAAFQSPGVDNPDARYLGPVARSGAGLVQRVEVDALLSPAVRAALFDAVEES